MPPVPSTGSPMKAAMVSGRDLRDYDALHRWSVEDREGFWSLVWDHCGVIGEKGARVLVDGDRMPGARRRRYRTSLRRRNSRDASHILGGSDQAQRTHRASQDIALLQTEHGADQSTQGHERRQCSGQEAERQKRHAARRTQLHEVQCSKHQGNGRKYRRHARLRHPRRSGLVPSACGCGSAT